MKLTDYFDKVYCINLDRRPDRWEHILNEQKKWGLGEIKRIPAYDGKNLNSRDYNTNLNLGNVGLILTNLDILKEAIANNYKSILILEDDVVFNGTIEGFNEYIDLVPDDWDMLSFGGNHNLHVNEQPPKKINNKVVKIHRTFSTHAIAIKSHMFNIIVELISDYQKPIDVYYTKLQKTYNFYCFKPAVATQLPSFSDIENKHTNYNNIIK